jgi:hypothetical protein
MEKLIQKYLIEFEMPITSSTISLVKEKYKEIVKLNYEYELSEELEKEINGKLNYIESAESRVRLLEYLIDHNEKLVEELREKKHIFWFKKNKTNKSKKEREDNIQLFKDTVLNKRNFNECILNLVGEIKKENKLNFDVRNAVLEVKKTLKI